MASTTIHEKRGKSANHKKRNIAIVISISLVFIIVVVGLGGAFLQIDNPVSEAEWVLSRSRPVYKEKVTLSKAKMDKGKVIGLSMTPSIPPYEVGELEMRPGTWFKKGGRYMVNVGVHKFVPIANESAHGETGTASGDTNHGGGHEQSVVSKSVASGDAELGFGDTKDLPDVGCSLTLIGMTAYAHMPPPSGMVGTGDGSITLLVTPYQDGPVVEESANIPPDGSGMTMVQTVKAGSITHIGDLNVFAPYTLDHDRQGYAAGFCVQDYQQVSGDGVDAYQRCNVGVPRYRLGEAKTYTDPDGTNLSLTLLAFTKSNDDLQAFTIRVVRQ